MKLARLALSLALAMPALLAAETPVTRGAAAPLGEPEMGTPTLHSIGIHWLIGGDENQNAEVRLAVRASGGDWQSAPPLWRVEPGAEKPAKGPGSVEVPKGVALFAGSALLLQPGTDYELKLTLSDPDGGGREATLHARTITEPAAPKDARILHVVPGKGGGSGSERDPFHGLAAADVKATPGTVFLIHAGAYPPFHPEKNGEPGQPIVWRGAGDGETVIDGGAERAKRLLSLDRRHDLWLENLVLQNGGKAVAGPDASRIVIRRCRIRAVEFGIFATTNDEDTTRDWFIADNILEGPCTWPRSKGIEQARGIQITGSGHVICYNRIRGFADAFDTVPSRHCADIDVHNNDISESTDDGLELDYSERNVRCFANRFTNVYQGISTQPVFGGPIYIFRNVLYNVVAEPFKLHNSPSGALIYHNTVVKRGTPFFVFTDKTIRYCRTRNNLFIGTEANYAFESSAKMRGCDFDFDGFGGGPWKLFLKWNDVRYATLDEARQKAPAWRHAVIVDTPTVFASGARPPESDATVCQPLDLRLRPGSAAIDAG